MEKLLQRLSGAWRSALAVLLSSLRKTMQRGSGLTLVGLGSLAVQASLSAAAARLAAAEPGIAAQAVSPGPTVPLPTLGGKQFWADQLFFQQWRIQRNAITGHYRLLDENNFRYASGTAEQCRAKLEQVRRERGLPPMHGEAVIVLHGLGRSRSSMAKLCKYLREKGGYTVFNVAYPSTQGEIGEHAQALRRIVENLEGIEEVNFVAHSMGNIVIRRYLADQLTPETAESDSSLSANNHPGGMRAAGRGTDPRLKRFVMLAPPNHGSLIALKLADIGLFRTVVGQPGQQLGRQWDNLEKQLATPSFEFGIIAGGKGNGRGWNPLLPGDNDGTISVATTRLAGAADFVVVPTIHTTIIEDEKVFQYTLRFLQQGCFLSPRQREPLKSD